MSLLQSNFPAGVEVEDRNGVLTLRIPDKTESLAPIVLLPEMANVLIQAGVSTRVRVYFQLRENTPLLKPERRLRVQMAANACVNLYEIYNAPLKAELKSKNIFELDRYSDLNYFCFVNGGKLTQIENEVFFKGEHGFATLKGLSVLSHDSEVSHRIGVHHDVGHCISRQAYKNILAGKAYASFDSLVHVAKGAIRSDSDQLNKNLILSEGAKADTRPKLQIDADDVSCTHGATIGQLQPNELFYLRSRGFSEAMARFVLSYGFAEEMLQSIEDARMKKELEAVATEEIEGALK